MRNIRAFDQVESLKSIPTGNCETDNQRGRTQAIQHVNNSDLSERDKKTIIQAICKAANPSGWYCENNGVNGAILELNSTISRSTTLTSDSKDNRFQSQKVTNKVSKRTFNRRNLNNLVSDGRIFSIEFIKRSTGELRIMTAKVGVKKHLQGSLKSYNTAQHNLLTFIDKDKLAQAKLFPESPTNIYS